MAIELLLTEENNFSGNIPWLKEWLKANPKSKETKFLITEVIASSKGNGYRVVSEYLQHWIWKNNKETKFLIEALEHYCSNPDSGYALFICVTNKEEAKASIGIDKEIKMEWYATKKGFSLLREDLNRTTSLDDGNPFL